MIGLRRFEIYPEGELIGVRGYHWTEGTNEAVCLGIPATIWAGVGFLLLMGLFLTVGAMMNGVRFPSWTPIAMNVLSVVLSAT